MATNNSPDDKMLIEMYRRMLRIRVFEETVADLARRGQLPGSVHSSVGQEGETVGACIALRLDDYMVGNHRSHGHPIAKGATLPGLMAEILGKSTGVCKGKGGSMHLADFSVGSLGETSIVASGIPVAAGAGLGCKLQGSDQVVLCFFGDGASNEGAFHEGLNLAAAWQLPVIFLCENNSYGATTHISEVMAIKQISQRAIAYGMPGETVDGQDAVAVYDVVRAAVERARSGSGPTLVEAVTYRYENHAVGLPVTAYREDSEIELWKGRDPLTIHRKRLIDSGVLDEAGCDGVVDEVHAEVAEALVFAQASPEPNLADLYVGMFTNPIPILT